MSNSSNNTMNTNNVVQQVKSNDEITPSKSSNRTEKRSAVEDVESETKKMKIETEMLEQKDSMASVTNTATSEFVSAATMAAPVSEISDEELLKFTLEFERTHGIQ